MIGSPLASALLVAAAWCCLTGSAWADDDLGRFGAAAAAALQKAQAAFNDLTAVREVVKAMEEGRDPGIQGNRWADLATKFRRAANDLRRAELPTAFDSRPYSFSLQQLQNCDTRGASLARAEKFLEELRAAQTRGASATATAEETTRRVAKAREALTYLISVHDRLVTVPIYGDIFKWDWFELNTAVSAALGDLASAVTSHRNRLDRSMRDLAAFIPNLDSNLTALRSLSCSVAAWWTGSATANGRAVSLDIELTQSNNVWNGRINLDGGGDTLRDIRVSGRSVSFTAGSGASEMRFTGTMTVDGASLAGAFSPPASGRFTLRRQPQ